MKAKKNPKISIERKRGLLFQIGLVITLLVVLVAFEWKSYEKTDYSLGQLQMDDLEDEMIPITRQEEKPPPPPPPPPEIIEIVEDEVEIENELEVEDTDTDENEFIEQEEEEDSDEVFLVVEQMPVFPGGDLGLMKFIQKTTKYPPIAKENDITGKVYVSYVVNKKGKVTNVKVVRSVDKYLDAEAVRVVKLLPYTTAGKQRGKPVNVQYTIPINFTLN
jgi:protein TonB